MGLKKKLITLKDELILKTKEHKVLKNHPVPNDKNIYRLVYINYHVIGELYNLSLGHAMIKETFEPFCFPNGMSREEGFKVLSYLSDYIESKYEYEPCSLSSVKILDSVLDLESYGFEKINDIDSKTKEDIIDLFTVSGNIYKFKSSEYYEKYFDWYIPNISREEIEKIYNKLGMNFEDVNFKNKTKRR